MLISTSRAVDYQLPRNYWPDRHHISLTIDPQKCTIHSSSAIYLNKTGQDESSNLTFSADPGLQIMSIELFANNHHGSDWKFDNIAYEFLSERQEVHVRLPADAAVHKQLLLKIEALSHIEKRGPRVGAYHPYNEPVELGLLNGM